MALTDDQRALLRLLAQREEGYEDIAALLGIGVDEVRARVKEALAGLEDETTVMPAKVPPPPPPAQSQSPSQSPPSPSRRRSLPRPRLPGDRRRLRELLGAGLIALLVVLFATGAVNLGGGDSDGNGSGNGGGQASRGEAIGAGEEEKLTQAQLQGVGGAEGASGRAIFGRVGKDEVVLQVTADDLEPTGRDQSYNVWLFRSPKLSLEIGRVKVGESGRLGARFPIPAELLAYVASGAFPQIRVSRTSDAAYRRELARAKRQEALPRYSGETVLRGEITGPLAEASPGS